MADDPADWEALHRGDPPHRVLITGAETVYEDDRYFPDCLVLRGAGKIIAILPKDNLLMLRRCSAPEPAGVPSPAVLAALARGTVTRAR